MSYCQPFVEHFVFRSARLAGKKGKSVLSEQHLSSLDTLSKCITLELDFMEPETSLGIGRIITTKHNTDMRTIQVKFVLLAGNKDRIQQEIEKL